MAFRARQPVGLDRDLQAGADPSVASYKQWSYTGATSEGSVVLDRDSGGSWPLRPGKYSVYLLQDDSYVKVAWGNFAVTSAG